jgi:dihydropteroate synthase
MTATRTAAAPAASARPLARPLVMGVVNCTPDSFHEASRATSAEAAVERALRLVEGGADLLDIGGQSTRPGSEPVSVEAERARVIPVIRALAPRVKVPISVDTDKARIAEEALGAGARIVNDVTALRGDPAMARVAAKAERVVLMHMLGTSPKTMQADPRYGDCFAEVSSFLRERLAAFVAAGGDAGRVWVDPGIGFGKTLDHNLELIRRVGELSAIAPVLLGVSRKSMFARLAPDAGPQDRLAGSLAAAVWAASRGVAVLRVHDALETRRALDAWAAFAGGAA